MWIPNDQSLCHSWIIGAAVVNAFYSPNRNQIGKPTLPLWPESSPSPLLRKPFSASSQKG